MNSNELYLNETMPRIKNAQKVIDSYLDGKTGVEILEAGCGSCSHFIFNNAKIVGIDISEKQLTRNKTLGERILGDITSFDFNGRKFDGIICNDVLEHLNNPERALITFFNSLKIGGILILGAPNRNSFWGLVTRLTPHFLHVAYYRHILGNRDAGREDTAPFPTPISSEMSVKFIEMLSINNNCDIVYLDLYEGHMQQVLRLRYRLFDFAMKLVGNISQKYLLSSFLMIIVKNSSDARQ